MILPLPADRVRYRLSHPVYGSKVVVEPKGWAEDELEYTRNSNYEGIVASLTNTLTFVADGAEFITDIYNIFGVISKITCTREVRHPETDAWTNTYRGQIDLTTYSEQQNEVSVKFTAGGLEELVKNRESTETEIEREEDMEGGTLPDPDLYDMELDNREIFLLSRLSAATETVGQPIGGQLAIPSQAMYFAPEMTADPNSDQEFLQSTLPGLHASWGTGNLPQMTIAWLDAQEPDDVQFFYFNNDRPKTLRLSWDFSIKVSQTYPSPRSTGVYISKYKYNFDTQDFTYIEEVATLATGTVPAGRSITLTGDNTSAPIEVDLEERECLLLRVALSGFSAAYSAAYQYITTEKLELKVVQESKFPKTLSKGIMAHELAERLIRIMTGGDEVFHSEALGRKLIGYEKDGVDTGALTAFSHGMWIRQFYKDEDAEAENRAEEDNRYKPFKISFNDFMAFFDAAYGLTLGIERIGLKERIIIEPKRYFYNLNSVIDLGEVSGIKRSVASDKYFSDISVGFSKPDGDDMYEEAMGLDEYNVRSEFTTCINVVDNTYEKVSPIRADSYGIEFARRKPYQNFPTEDTDYDTDVFALDVKVIETGGRRKRLALRTWQDDFEEQPRGIFSPDTAHNLRFSPLNMLKRQGEYLTGLDKYPERKIMFSSSEGNTGLETKTDGEWLRETEDLENSVLNRPRIIPETIELEKPVDFFLNQKLLEESLINGKKVPNLYTCIRFTNEYGEAEYGFIQSIKPKESGTYNWKLIKANR